MRTINLDKVKRKKEASGRSNMSNQNDCKLKDVSGLAETDLYISESKGIWHTESIDIE
jgi:hypothetical protein